MINLNCKLAVAPKQVETRDSVVSSLVLVSYSGGRTVYYVRKGEGRARIRLGDSNHLTIKKAREAAIAAMADNAAGITFGSVFSEVMENGRLSGVASVKKDTVRYEMHIEPLIGAVGISACGLSNVKEVMENLPAEHSDATRNRVLALIRKVFIYAMKVGYVSEDPTRHLSFRQEVKRSIPEPDDDLIRKVNKAVKFVQQKNPVAGNLIKLLQLSGMRLGEAQGLLWGDINTVSKQVSLPKTKSGKMRFVPLNPEALELLEELREEAGEPSEDAYVFCSEITGGPISRPARLWKDACVKAGLPDSFCLHGLRHLFASVSVREGVPLYTVQGLLGHSSIRMTERYSSLARGELLAASGLVAGAMSAAEGGAK